MSVSGQASSRRRALGAPEALAEARLYLDSDMEQTELYHLAGARAVVFSARCPDRSGANEDAAALIPCGPERAVVAVADGLGGQPAGEQAASVALEALRATVEAAHRRGEEDLRPAILDGIEAANRTILGLGVGAATTLAVAELQGSTLRPYHVGDSLILMVSQRGRVKLQTVSHSPVGYAVESGMLDERDAMHHEDRHLISNLVGSSDMRIEVGSALGMALRDTVLLATDGLLDNVHVEEIVTRIRKGRLAQTGRELARESLRRMREHPPDLPSKPDDLTFVMLRRDPRRRRPRSATERTAP